MASRAVASLLLAIAACGTGVVVGPGHPDAPADGALAADAATLDGASRADAPGLDAGPPDSRPVDARPVDARPVDARPVDARPPDAFVPACPDVRAASPAVDGPVGMMIQPVTVGGVCDLERALDHICRAHRSGAGTIHDLVLTDVVRGGATGPTETLHTEVLDVVLRYRGCYDNLFLGTIPETILADPYDPSVIGDAAARWQWLLAARRVADSLVAYMSSAAPDMVWHWYVSYEANLNYFTGASYRDAYVALLLQHTADLAARRAGAVLWSPTFWTDFDSLSSSARADLQAAIADFFTRVPAITWVVVQDHVGVSSAFECADAVGYWGVVHAAAPGLHLQLNMEYFDMRDGSIGPGDPVELAARLACYRAAGVPVGASFEFRFWYDRHGH